MTNEQFQKLRQFTLVKTRTMSGKVYQPNYKTGKVEIIVTSPLRRRGQRAHVKYENVEIEAQNTDAAFKVFQQAPARWIEQHTIKADCSHRGSEIRVDVEEIFPFTYPEQPILGCYQNYLGGGIAGKIEGASMFLPKTEQEFERAAEIKKAIVEYFFGLNNGGGDEYMQENHASLEFNQSLPVSGY